MNNVTDLSVTRIYIFPVRSVPLDLVESASSKEALREKFSFTPPEPDLPIPVGIRGLRQLMFANGELRLDDTLITIPNVRFEERRILLTVNGPSAQANIIYDGIIEALESIAPERFGILRYPTHIAVETRCVARLEFDFSQLFQPAVKKFEESIVMAAERPGITATTSPSVFVSTITYNVTDPNLLDHRISLNPKQFLIQPQPGTPDASRLYQTASPFDSDVHMGLLKALEASI